VLMCRKLAEKRKRDDVDESDLDVSRQTAVEAEDMWEEELRAFTPASRITGTFYQMDFGAMLLII
jgi:hypothetical protein